jgi:dCMP deaminase
MDKMTPIDKDTHETICEIVANMEGMHLKRLSREQYYRAVLDAVALRGSCNRGRSGAVLVKRGRIIATGYVGSPSGTKHCDDVGHELEVTYTEDKDSGSPSYHTGLRSEHCIRTTHAEMNAILQASRYGPSIEGSELYCTMFPCYSCAKAIVNAGIAQVHATWDYQKSARSKSLFDEVGITWTLEHEEKKKYEEE